MDYEDGQNPPLLTPQYTDPTEDNLNRRWKYSSAFRALDYGQIVSMSVFVFIVGVTLLAVDRFNQQPNSFTPSFAAKTSKPSIMPVATPKISSPPLATKSPTPRAISRTPTPVATPVQ